jgi:hypothetical protein
MTIESVSCDSTGGDVWQFNCTLTEKWRRRSELHSHLLNVRGVPFIRLATTGSELRTESLKQPGTSAANAITLLKGHQTALSPTSRAYSTSRAHLVACDHSGQYGPMSRSEAGSVRRLDCCRSSYTRRISDHEVRGHQLRDRQFSGVRGASVHQHPTALGIGIPCPESDSQS